MSVQDSEVLWTDVLSTQSTSDPEVVNGIRESIGTGGPVLDDAQWLEEVREVRRLPAVCKTIAVRRPRSSFRAGEAPAVYGSPSVSKCEPKGACVLVVYSRPT